MSFANPFECTFVDYVVNRTGNPPRIAGLRKDEAGLSRQLPNRMDARGDHRQARRNGLQGDEGKTGPHKTIRKDREVGDWVGGSECCSREEAVGSEQLIGPDPAPDGRWLG